MKVTVATHTSKIHLGYRLIATRLIYCIHYCMTHVRVNMVLIVGVMGLSGCAVLENKVTEESKVPSKHIEVPSDQLGDLTLKDEAYWLGKVKAALTKNHLISPAEDNAWYYYQQVLGINANNVQAIQGLQSIAKYYVNIGQKRLDSGDIEQAHVFLNKARKVWPGYAPALTLENNLDLILKAPRPSSFASAENSGVPEPLQTQAESKVESPEGTQRQNILLPPELVLMKSSYLQQYLSGLAKQIERVDARLNILVERDEQGRWIYQQLNQISPHYRIRANITIDTSTAILATYKGKKLQLDVYE